MQGRGNDGQVMLIWKLPVVRRRARGCNHHCAHTPGLADMCGSVGRCACFFNRTYVEVGVALVDEVVGSVLVDEVVGSDDELVVVLEGVLEVDELVGVVVLELLLGVVEDDEDWRKWTEGGRGSARASRDEWRQRGR